MLVLNGAVRDNAVIIKAFDSKFQSPDYIHKNRKLNASNIAFLQSLRFAVGNVWNDWHSQYRGWANLWWSYHQDWVSYNSYANTTFEYSAKIRIRIQQQDLYTLPHKSFIYIEGKFKIKKPTAGSDVVLRNNCVAFMFNEVWYELDGVEIDRNRNVGIISKFKNYVTMFSNRSVIARNAGLGSMKSSK